MWAVFAGVVSVSLVVDLALHRGHRRASRRAAIVWSVTWIATALAFAAWIGIRLGHGPAEDFLTAYLVEKALSLDNLFMFLLVFGRMRITPQEQHRVLFWGILGALIFRGLLIAAGTAVIVRWQPVAYVLGAFLVFGGLRMLRSESIEVPAEGRITRLARERLHLRSPFLLAVITIEVTDIMFALDSLPAVLAVSSDPFIIYTSNVFAILGLRALYLVLADLLGRLHYMQYGLAAILVLAGIKLLTSRVYHVPPQVSLAALAAILAVTIATSVIAARRRPR